MKYLLPILLLVLSACLGILLWRSDAALKWAAAETQAALSTLEHYQQVVHGDSLLLSGDLIAARAYWRAFPHEGIMLHRLHLIDSTEHHLHAQRQALADAQAPYAQALRQWQQGIEQASRLQSKVSELSDALTEQKAARQQGEEQAAREATAKDSLLAATEERLDSLGTRIAQLQRKQMLRMKSPAGVDLVYFGEVRGEQPHGEGKAYYANGTSYEGTWDNGEKHGQGVYLYADGERYEGTFVRNKRNGYGLYKWPNGDVYRGHWANDMRHGEGAIYTAQGSVVRGGIWKEDKLAEARDLPAAQEDQHSTN